MGSTQPSTYPSTGPSTAPSKQPSTEAPTNNPTAVPTQTPTTTDIIADNTIVTESAVPGVPNMVFGIIVGVLMALCIYYATREIFQRLESGKDLDLENPVSGS